VFEMVVAGRVVEDDVAIMMVEAEASDNAWNLVKNQGQQAPTEEVVAEGLEAAKPFIRTLVEAQDDLVGRAAKETREFPRFLDYEYDVFSAVEKEASSDLSQALTIGDKQEREAKLDEITANTLEKLAVISSNFASRSCLS